MGKEQLDYTKLKCRNCEHCCISDIFGNDFCHLFGYPVNKDDSACISISIIYKKPGQSGMFNQ